MADEKNVIPEELLKKAKALKIKVTDDMTEKDLAILVSEKKSDSKAEKQAIESGENSEKEPKKKVASIPVQTEAPRLGKDEKSFKLRILKDTPRIKVGGQWQKYSAGYEGNVPLGVGASLLRTNYAVEIK